MFALVGCNQDFHSNLCKHQAIIFHLTEESVSKTTFLQPPQSNSQAFPKTEAKTVLKGAGINRWLLSFWTLSTGSIAAYMLYDWG